jgi:hypothetical protein
MALARQQRTRMQRELESLLFLSRARGGSASGIDGGDAERAVASAYKGRVVAGNRATPDVSAEIEGGRISVKTERARASVESAAELIGKKEDLIIGRFNLADAGVDVRSGAAADLGTAVLQMYDARVREFNWERLAVMLRVERGDVLEVAYFEEYPVRQWGKARLLWEDTPASTPGKRVIAGYARKRDGSKGDQLVRWTESGNQLYLYFLVPRDAEVLRVATPTASRSDVSRWMREQRTRTGTAMRLGFASLAPTWAL